MARLLIIIALFLLSSCATQSIIPEKIYVKNYKGNDVPETRLALLKPADGAAIDKIDGEEFQYGPASSHNDFDVALLPGEHIVHVYFRSMSSTTRRISGFSSRGSIAIRFQAEANHRYLIKANTIDSQYGPVGWQPTIIDVTGKAHCWTIKTKETQYSC